MTRFSSGLICTGFSMGPFSTFTTHFSSTAFTEVGFFFTPSLFFSSTFFSPPTPFSFGTALATRSKGTALPADTTLFHPANGASGFDTRAAPLSSAFFMSTTAGAEGAAGSVGSDDHSDLKSACASAGVVGAASCCNDCTNSSIHGLLPATTMKRPRNAHSQRRRCAGWGRCCRPPAARSSPTRAARSLGVRPRDGTNG